MNSTIPGAAGASAVHVLPRGIARIHDGARAHPGLARFALLNRILLATAFLPTGLVKLTGQRFTILPLEHPIGFFFEAMYRTGPYWTFIGGMQVLAAVLLLVPATATLGALLFLPIGVSIVLITWGVGFGNTVWIAAGMLLSVTYLLCWDADRIWDAVSRLTGRRREATPSAGINPTELWGWVLGAAALLAFFLTTRGFLPGTLALPAVVLGGGGGALVLWGSSAQRRAARKRPEP